MKKCGVSQALLSNRGWFKPGAEEAVGAEPEPVRLLFLWKVKARSNTLNNLSSQLLPWRGAELAGRELDLGSRAGFKICFHPSLALCLGQVSYHFCMFPHL